MRPFIPKPLSRLLDDHNLEPRVGAHLGIERVHYAQHAQGVELRVVQAREPVHLEHREPAGEEVWKTRARVTPAPIWI